MAAKTVEQRYADEVERLRIDATLLTRDTDPSTQHQRLDAIIAQATEAQRLLAVSAKKRVTAA